MWLARRAFLCAVAAVLVAFGWPRIALVAQATLVPLIYVFESNASEAASTVPSEHPPPLRWPLQGKVVAFFTAQDPFGPGHRGIDIVSSRRAIVRAAHRGTVSFVGEVGGIRSVTIVHPSGWKTSYSFIEEALVAEGAEVERGTPLATSGRLHGRSDYGVHFSLRFEDDYRDPLPHMIGSRPILLPPPSDASPKTDSTSPSDSTDKASPGTHPLSRPSGPTFAGCSVILVDCGGVIGSLLGRQGAGMAAILERARRLGEGFLHKTAIVADWAARAEQTVAKVLRLRIRDTTQALSGLIAGLSTFPLQASTQAALVFEPLSPQLARRIRRRGLERAKWLESEVAQKMNQLIGESLEPSTVALAVREQAAALARYETERVKRLEECLQRSDPDVASQPASSVEDSFVRESRDTQIGSDDVVYLVVPGLGSRWPLLDARPDLADALQARGHEVVRFSYRGFGLSADNEVLPQPFDPSDTQQDILISARILADQIQAIKKANPDQKVVVVAHSQGGIVARSAARILLHRSTGSKNDPQLSALVTVASPNRGSGAADDYVRVSRSRTGRDFMASLGKGNFPPPDAESIRQIAWGSEFMKELGSRAPRGVPTTSIAASTDVVVPAYETLIDGGTNLIFSTRPDGLEAHSDIARDPRTLAAIEAAAVGRTICQSWKEVAEATSVSALTTVGIEGLRDSLADALVAG